MKTCLTVGELVAALLKFPADAPLMVDGADCGGYDVGHCRAAQVTTCKQFYQYRHEDQQKYPENAVIISGVDPY